MEKKTYTLIRNIPIGSSRNHILVRAACINGLTSVTITQYKNSSPLTGKSGWYIDCDQVSGLHLGFNIAEATTRINQIKSKP